MDKQIFHRCKNWKDSKFTCLKYENGKWVFLCSEAHKIVGWNGSMCPYCGIKLNEILKKYEKPIS
jgi:hypothetical protein